MSASKQVAFRLPDLLVRRLDRHARRMTKAAPGVRLTRTDAVISLLTDALDREEGVVTFECEGCSETFTLEEPYMGKDAGTLKAAIWEQATGGNDVLCHECFETHDECSKCGSRSSSMMGDVCGACWDATMSSSRT